MTASEADTIERFRAEYAAVRESEGRGLTGEALRSLPFLAAGPLAREWKVRARTFIALLRHVVEPLERHGPLDVLDLGAGNGWLSYRLACRGHRCTALDLRDDTVDGLGAAEELGRLAAFECRAGSFEELPFPDRSMDLAVFNASLHYATDLAAVMAEAKRCMRSGGTIAILDSPFYPRASDGAAMVREKRRVLGVPAIDSIEFLTPAGLRAASGLAWRRHKVRYPLWYELRPVVARLRGARRPSRFDLWTATVG